ncbi:MFS transporter [Microbacterium halophytorum]|uniref:MFS transporter n=1 Tax=Microbacterium halophytorum TaxID=2067568 RepID=UPI001E2B344E|nr:MFS transporter [Microbacterium halophytorum]
MSQMFRSLASFNYRAWFAGALVSNVGNWMQSTALSWVVLTELTNNNAGAMGLTLAIRFAPPLLLVAVTGWVVDRFDRRRLLMLTQTLLGVSSIAIGVMLVTGTMTLHLMYGFALLTGIFTAVDNPARQTFVSDIVGSGLASNAIALNSASFNSARMIGPAAAGVLIEVLGSGWVFLIDAGTFLAMLVALAVIRPGELQPRPKRGSGGRLADGFRYAATRPDLMVVFTIILLLGALAMNFPIYASTMAIEFGREADGFGLLSSVLAIGSLAGALLAARRARARFRVVVAATGAFAVIAAVSAAMPNYWAYAVLLIGVGFSTVTTLTTANGYVQTTTPPEVRGRVMAIYMAILMGGTPLGAPLVGWVADSWGPRAAIMVGAVGALVACLIGIGWMIASGRVHRAPAHRFLLAVDDTTAIRLPDQRDGR